MYARVRFEDRVVYITLPSRLSSIEALRCQVADKFGVEAERQMLFYGGKLLEDGCTLYDYGMKHDDTIQLLLRPRDEPDDEVARPQPVIIYYTNFSSMFFRVGDLVDVRGLTGSWIEGEIVKIKIFEHAYSNDELFELIALRRSVTSFYNAMRRLLNNIRTNEVTTYEQRRDNQRRLKLGWEKMKKIKNDFRKIQQLEEKIVFFDVIWGKYKLPYKLSKIRPRARNKIDMRDVKVNQMIMLFYNNDRPSELGFWNDFTVKSIINTEEHVKFVGTLRRSKDVSVTDVTVCCPQQIFTIEKTIPLLERSQKDEDIMITETEKRKPPYNCIICFDDENVLCGGCICTICTKKTRVYEIISCNECNHTFHTFCLVPPLEEPPTEDWYCPTCKTDIGKLIAPGIAKQQCKNTGNKKDWARGMACVGRTKSCRMPINYFGPIPGIEVGMLWRYRFQLSETGVHRPLVSGIHGRVAEGIFSLVLSLNKNNKQSRASNRYFRRSGSRKIYICEYKNNIDNGYEFTYSISGGRYITRNRRSRGQTLTGVNRALARNCAAKKLSKKGADAKDNWRDGKPVRVSRNYKMKTFSDYAPEEGVRYDGIYKVVKYYPETGKSGFPVWKYLLRRDDPIPAPWEENAKNYSIKYPDGYLEAKAETQREKQGLKGGKNSKEISNKNNNADIDYVEKQKKPSKKRSKHDSPPQKKRKLSPSTSTTSKIKSLAHKVEEENPELEKSLDMSLIENDVVNKKLWEECIIIFKASGKQRFINKVTEQFMCVICQDIAAYPITTVCRHNFCNECLNLAFESTGSKICPYCREDLSNQEMVINKHLQIALRKLMPEYDVGKK